MATAAALREQDPEIVRTAVEDGLRRYFASRRARIPLFIDRHFSLGGSLALHRRALGLDLLRAPANLALAAPNAARLSLAAACRRCGWRGAAERLEALRLLRQTAVARELEWLVMTELLELPFRQGDRVATRDALAETIFADPRILQHPAMLAARQADGAARHRMARYLAQYADARLAAAEIATGFASIGTGAVLLHQVTPGVMTFGPALATLIAQQAAIASFPLGATLGTLWYAAFPVAASFELAASLSGGLLLLSAALTAFAGVVTDPLQRILGLHRRRLERLLDLLEREWTAGDGGGLVVRDHYVARLLDLLDLLACAWRAASP